MPLPKTRHIAAIFAVLLIQLLFAGCAGSSGGPDPMSHGPLKSAIANGDEVWDVRIEQEDDIVHFYVLQSDKVVGYHIASRNSETGAWGWKNWEESGTATKQLDGQRESDGTITVHTTTETSLMTIDSKRSISDGKVTGETKAGSTSRGVTGTATQIN